MIVTRGLCVDSTDDENGNVTLQGLGLWTSTPPAIVPLLKINMDGQMQNLDGGMRG